MSAAAIRAHRRRQRRYRHLGQLRRRQPQLRPRTGIVRRTGQVDLAGSSDRVEVAVEAVYFYDFLNADGDTDFRDLSDEARDRAGRGIYLNDAFVGIKENIDDAG